MLGAEDVGHRVVVRRAVARNEAGRPVLTDTLGELVALDEARLVVRRDADGSDVTVDRADIVAAKRVPPRPRRIAVADLARVTAEAWPAPETEPLGDWLLRAADGFTGRANTALAAGDPGTDLPTALDRVAAWYAARGLPAGLQVQLPADADVDALAAGRGWTAAPDVVVLTASLPAVLAAADRAPSAHVHLTDRPGPGFLALVEAARGPLPGAALAILTGPPAVAFAEITEGDRTIAIGRGAVVDGWLGIALVQVLPEHRRRGLARRILAALAGWAAGHPATDVFLQVERQNTAALGLYARLGFRPHHDYRYRRQP